MLLVSFHDDKAGNNVALYSDTGVRENEKVLTKIDLGTAELRGLSFAPDGALWVLNGAASASEILRFSPSGKIYEYTNTVANRESVDSLWHPFDLVFTAEGTPRVCYVSNQDTDVVAWFVLAPDCKSVKPLPPPPALPSGGTFLTGTFAAASPCELPRVRQTTPVRQLEGGLNVAVELLEHKDEKTGARELQEKVTHSVRGVALSGRTLYVADEPGSAIKLYDVGGEFLGQTEPIEAPVHLCVHKESYKNRSVETLYASGALGVFCATLPLPEKGKRIFELSGEPLIEQKDASGIAFGPTTLYVGARKSGEIYAYEGFSREAKEHPHKPFSVIGSPEFILYVADSTGG
jgi:hypothetical protein